MEKVEGSREMLEELFNLPRDHTALEKFALKIGACTTPYDRPGAAQYGELFHNCLDVINLKQQIEQSEVLSKQTTWIERYTIATFALVGVTFVLAAVTVLMAILKPGVN